MTADVLIRQRCENLGYLVKDRFSLISVAIVSLFLIAILSVSNTLSQSGEIAQVAVSSIDSSGQKRWLSDRNFANLGFTDQILEFDLVYQNTDFLLRQRFLTVSPSYTDYVQVTHLDAWDNEIQRQSKGDRVEHVPTMRWDFDYGSYVFDIPSNAKRSIVQLSGTGNLRAHIDVLNQSELIRATFHAAGIQYFILAILIVGAVATLSFGLLYRDGILISAGCYLTSWVILLLGLSNTLRVYVPETNRLSDYLVSLGAISATGLGAYTHARLIEYGARSRVLSWILRAAAWFALILLTLFALGFHREALAANILIITIIPFVMFIGVLIVLPRNRVVAIFWRRVRVLYAGLFLVVTVTAISGLGIGNQLSLTYFHALLTMAVLMFLLLTRSSLERRFYVRSQIRNRTLKQAKSILENQLEDQRSFISMLTHEIKTPLTTLKLLTRKMAQSDAVGAQISHIDHVVDQTRLLEMMITGSTVARAVDLQSLVLAEINRLSQLSSETPEIAFRWRGQAVVIGDPLVLSSVIRNLLENAVKYSTKGTRIGLSIFDVRGYLGIRLRNQTPFAVDDPSNVFSKYWRSNSVTGIRGTGLGLWIVKKICRANGYQVKAKMIDDQFVIEVVLRTEHP